MSPFSTLLAAAMAASLGSGGASAVSDEILVLEARAPSQGRAFILYANGTALFKDLTVNGSGLGWSEVHLDGRLLASFNRNIRMVSALGGGHDYEVAHPYSPRGDNLCVLGTAGRGLRLAVTKSGEFGGVPAPAAVLRLLELVAKTKVLAAQHWQPASIRIRLDEEIPTSPRSMVDLPSEWLAVAIRTAPDILSIPGKYEEAVSEFVARLIRAKQVIRFNGDAFRPVVTAELPSNDLCPHQNVRNLFPPPQLDEDNLRSMPAATYMNPAPR